MHRPKCPSRTADREQGRQKAGQGPVEGRESPLRSRRVNNCQECHSPLLATGTLGTVWPQPQDKWGRKSPHRENVHLQLPLSLLCLPPPLPNTQVVAPWTQINTNSGLAGPYHQESCAELSPTSLWPENAPSRRPSPSPVKPLLFAHTDPSSLGQLPSVALEHTLR